MFYWTSTALQYNHLSQYNLPFSTTLSQSWYTWDGKQTHKCRILLSFHFNSASLSLPSDHSCYFITVLQEIVQDLGNVLWDMSNHIISNDDINSVLIKIMIFLIFYHQICLQCQARSHPCTRGSLWQCLWHANMTCQPFHQYTISNFVQNNYTQKKFSTTSSKFCPENSKRKSTSLNCSRNYGSNKCILC